ncbi:MAG: internal scaffolding protein [Microviridae sp.]|nr:MAG: internal scaffolding protein [Microviridae sp.]
MITQQATLMTIDEDGVITSVGITEKPFVRTPYNYDRDAASEESGLCCTDESMTQQQFKEECDINTIIKNFGVTGQLPATAKQPMVGDFTNIGDFQEAMQAVEEAQQNFMLLPSKVREKFGQDPKKFVEFCVDPKNIDAVRELGLAPPAVIAPKTEEKPA